ncbi:MAG: IS200/IS605 family transposase [Lachnospiraceae bacterium]
MAKKENALAHTKWMCKYHIVFTPKYRRKMIYNQYREDVREIIKQLCSYKGVEILGGNVMSDHVHILVSIPPKMSVSSFMGYLKGKSALMMFDRHANLKYKFGNRHFWSEGYYVSTVGLNEAVIKKYIQDQEKYDIAMDKLSVKEYEDPLRVKAGSNNTL